MRNSNSLKKIGFAIAFLMTMVSLGGCQKSEPKLNQETEPAKAEPMASLSPYERKEADDYSNNVDENQESYKKCENAILGLTTEGVSVVSYFSDDGLVKLEIGYFGEMGKFEEVEYLKKGKTVLIRDLDTNYNVPIYEEGSRVESEIPSKIYFKDQKIVAWVRNGTTIDPSSEDFIAREKQWNDEMEELKIKERISAADCKLDNE